MKRRSFVMAFSAFAVPLLRARAYQIPEVRSVVEFFPDALQFGEGWSRSNVEQSPPSDDSPFLEEAEAAYGGPEGQRARIEMYRHGTSRREVNDAWESLTWHKAFEVNRDGYDIPLFGGDDFDNVPLPDGTVDADRSKGTLIEFEYAVGVGVYAVEPDIVFMISTETATAGNLFLPDTVAGWIISRIA